MENHYSESQVREMLEKQKLHSADIYDRMSNESDLSTYQAIKNDKTTPFFPEPAQVVSAPLTRRVAVFLQQEALRDIKNEQYVKGITFALDTIKEKLLSDGK